MNAPAATHSGRSASRPIRTRSSGARPSSRARHSTLCTSRANPRVRRAAPSPSGQAMSLTARELREQVWMLTSCSGALSSRSGVR